MTASRQLASHLNVELDQVKNLGGKYFEVVGKRFIVAQLQPKIDEKNTDINLERLSQSDSFIIFVEEHKASSTPRAVFDIPSAVILSHLENLSINNGRAWIQLLHNESNGWYLNLNKGKVFSLDQYEKEAYTPEERIAFIKGLQNKIFSNS